jgi:predicted DsbA family dithiol-disulfide isomerase
MDLNSHEVLKAEALKAGLEEGSIDTLLSDKAGRGPFETQVRHMTSHAGVTGVPHFIINKFLSPSFVDI